MCYNCYHSKQQSLRKIVQHQPTHDELDEALDKVIADLQPEFKRLKNTPVDFYLDRYTRDALRRVSPIRPFHGVF